MEVIISRASAADVQRLITGQASDRPKANYPQIPLLWREELKSEPSDPEPTDLMEGLSL